MEYNGGLTMSQDLYFYKGKFRTDEGLKRALIKDDIVTISPNRAYYLWEEKFEYYYDYDMLKDYCTDYEYITKEEANNFRKWLNKMVKEGKIEVVHHQWYHCDENDNIGTEDWWDTREAIIDNMDRWDPRWPDDFIEHVERTVEAYGDTISQEEENGWRICKSFTTSIDPAPTPKPTFSFSPFLR